MQDELDIIDGNQHQSNEIPVFLKVLCILTFVGSGLSIVGGIFYLIAGDQMMEFQTQFGSKDAFELFGYDYDEMMKWQRFSHFTSIISGGLGLTGALLMWKLKRVGYYIYLPSCIAPIIVSVFAMQSMPEMLRGFGMIGVVITALFYGAFVVMYGLNFKHLK